MAVTPSDPRCRLPEPLTRSLEEVRKLLPAADVTQGRYDPVGMGVRCFQTLHVVFATVCSDLFALPTVVALVGQPSRFEGGAWQGSLLRWASAQRQQLQGWSVQHPECVAPALQLRISGVILEDYAEQLWYLAEAARGDTTPSAARRWLYHAQSGWHMAVYYLTCLQYLSLSAFGATSDLAFQLHRHRYTPGIAFQEISSNLPVFRLPRTRRLRHDEVSAAAVLSALRHRLSSGVRGDPPVRFAEVGVFRANLSAHVWRRAAFGKGRRLLLHLVDHWGAATEPRSGAASVAPMGTGSNMAGTSNSTLFHALVRRFSRTGRCVQVPYGLPEGAGRVAASAGGDVFFHRTTSVGAANAFEDESLDVVYIDADHKWWSVVQDLAAWWPKLRRGGVMLGHDFHLNELMEREGAAGGDSNDVPLAVLAFFRGPAHITLHSGFVWSVEKPLVVSLAKGDGASGIGHRELCGFLRERLAPHWQFEVCPES